MLWLLLATAQLETPDPRPVRADAAWLVGTWLFSADRSDLDRGACSSGTTFTYKADGTTEFFEGNGRWQPRGDRLWEAYTEIFRFRGPAIGRGERALDQRQDRAGRPR